MEDTQMMQDILNICKEKGILVDFLEKYGTDAISAMCSELREDELKRLAWKEGSESGFNDGMKKGIEKVYSLTERLIEANRFEDLKRSAVDPAYQAKLFKEFGL